MSYQVMTCPQCSSTNINHHGRCECGFDVVGYHLSQTTHSADAEDSRRKTDDWEFGDGN